MSETQGGSHPETARRIVFEVVALWLAVNLLISIVSFVRNTGALDGLLGVIGLPGDIILIIAPLAFMYGPVLLCRWRGVDPWNYPMALPRLRDWAIWRSALFWNFVLIGGISLPFVAGYHLWHTWVPDQVVAWVPGWLEAELPRGWERALPGVGRFEGFVGSWDEVVFWVAVIVGHHLIFVAIPEEFFYRGYIQTRLDEAFSAERSIAGAKLGWGIVLASLLFAFGHSIVIFQPWWQVFIFFPGMVFGWLRARTGDAMAGAFFHAACNVGVMLLEIHYGLQPIAQW